MNRNLFLLLFATFCLVAPPKTYSTEVTYTVPANLLAFAEKNDCIFEDLDDSGAGRPFVYGVIPGYESSAALICIKRYPVNDPVLGVRQIRSAFLLLKGVPKEFGCSRSLRLAGPMASLGIRDGRWDLSEFDVIADARKVLRKGVKKTLNARMIILTWEGNLEIGLVCHKGNWNMKTFYTE